MPEQNEFTREVVVRPAWDCLKVQPCVHGSALCSTDPRGNHGRGTAKIVFTLRANDDEVQLDMLTEWWRSETPPHVQARVAESFPLYSRALFYYHSREPFDESRSSSDPDGCPRNWAKCHSFTDYAYGPVGGQILVEQGSDALWDWLAERWQEKYELTSEEQK